MENRSRQITIFILLALVLALAGFSIYVALSLQGTPAPTPGGTDGDVPVADTSCDIEVPGGAVNSSITIPANDEGCPAGDYIVQKHVEDATDKNGDGTITNEDCVGTSVPQYEVVTLQKGGTIDLQDPRCGKCIQIDIIPEDNIGKNIGGPYGTAGYTGACEVEENPNIRIRKVVNSDKTVYRVGETIPYKVTITNTGDVTFESLQVRDTYDKSYLKFIDGNVEYRGKTAEITTSDLNENTQNINISNILERLDNLRFRPEDQMVLLLNFEAIAPSEGTTRNKAIAKAGDIEKEDTVDVEIVEEEELVCGDECTTSSQCPQNHTCSAGTCVLNSCLDDPENCTSNGCQLLPETAIFDDPSGIVLLGMVFLLLGVVTYKFNTVTLLVDSALSNDRLALMLLSKDTDRYQQAYSSIQKSKISKKRNQFEDKFN